MKTILFFALDKETSIRVVFHIRIELGDELDSQISGGLLHTSPWEPKNFDTLGYTIEDSLRSIVVSAAQTIKHSVRFNVMKRNSLPV